MPVSVFSSSGRPDKPFIVAVIVAAGFAGAQLAAVGLHYMNRASAARQAMQPATPATEPTPFLLTTPAPATAQTQTAPPPAATDAAPAAPSDAALSTAERLLREATLLRERGDTNNALARLQDAAQRDPANANVLAEMAMIYESMQLYDRSAETWRRIHQIGPSAGALYELADMKLRVGASPAAAAPAATGPGFASSSPLDAVGSRYDAEGIPDGSTFGITEATLTENTDPDAESNLTLRVGVKARSNTLIDHTRVKIQVFFYDTEGGSDRPVLTDADVNYEWITPNRDWKNSNPEVLAVSYVRMKAGALSPEEALTEAAANVTPPVGGRPARTAKKPAQTGPRKYAGYQVRVYYNDQLQDVRAEPTKLLNLYPPPLTLPSQ
jgi:hypothetical protein